MKLNRIIAISLLSIAIATSAGCANTAPPVDRAEMQSQVQNDIAQVMRDIATAEKANPAIALSSNPFTYAEISPALDRLVARGEPALDSIAEEIEESPENGLREYLLAIAGQRIMGADKTIGTWSTAKEWARYYRTSK